MGFKFAHLCDLLSSLEENKIAKASTNAKKTNPDVRAITRWFARHDQRLHDPNTDQLALLSCMFPEKRTDRVYWLQDTSLARVIGRCLLLGSSRREELERWRLSGQADLGECVENVMRQAENHIASGQEVTIEEIDSALNQIASRCRFSGPQIRRQRTAVDVERTLAPLYRRLSSRDAKWLTRMILKSYGSVALPQRLTLRSFHFLLPHLLVFQDSFEVALKMLASDPVSNFPSHPEPGLAKDLGKIALQYLAPNIGVKIGRPEYYKARSIKHCCQMVDRRRMSVERKYDGEYCQIHIDLSKHPDCIQIFSKSGKDSTNDRSGVHQAIKDSLRIGKSDCKFSRRCILEGELIVWSDKHSKILEFHKLRKFISRSGVFIGTENDSPPQPYEHLMIIFFDILLLDDDICLRKPHRERRLLLKNTMQAISGHADIADQRVLDFSRPDSHSRLEGIFAQGIAERWEGFVLKGCEDPYFTISSGTGEGSAGRWIKLKKDYIPGLGDTIDLALVGATYNSRDAATLGLVSKVSWTHFFVGCLVNKEAVLQSGARPQFRVVDVIGRHCMSERTMQTLNRLGKYTARDQDSDHLFDVEYGRAGLPLMDVIFKTPFVVEIMGSGFEKPSGARYFALRFPRITNILSDRSFEDAASFTELQLLAEHAVSVPHEDLIEEEQEWAKRVKSTASMLQYIEQRSQSSSAISRVDTAPSGASLSPLSLRRADRGPTESPIRPSSEHIKTAGSGVPIYIDHSTASCLSSKPTEPRGNSLTSNENLSSHGNLKKRAASPSASEDCHKDAHTGPSGVARTKRKLIASTPSMPDTAAGTQVSSKNQREQAESPLKLIPLYINVTPSSFGYGPETIPRNAADTLDNFLDMIESNSHHTSSLDIPNLGIIFTDTKKILLSTTLLELSSRVSERLKSPRSTTKYPASGRVLVLNATVLSHAVLDTITTPSCLQEIWGNLSREYFYACVAWNSKTDACLAEDEIPGTPMDVGGAGLDTDTTEILRQGAIPKISILFDLKELLPLEKSVSRDSEGG